MGHHSVGFIHILAALVVLACTLLLVMSRSLMQGISHNVNRWISVAYLILSMISMAILQKNQHKYETHHSVLTIPSDCSSREDDKLEQILDDFALPIGLVIFGSAGITLRMFYALSDFQCIGFFLHHHDKTNFSFISNSTAPDVSNYISQGIPILIHNLAILIFFCAQMPFLCRIHTFKALKVRYSLHHLVLLIAGANFARWLRSFYRNTHFSSSLTTQYGQYQPLEPVTLEEACLQFSSAADTFAESTLKYAFLPFGMMYMLASLEVLIQMWLLPIRLACSNGTGTHSNQDLQDSSEDQDTVSQSNECEQVCVSENNQCSSEDIDEDSESVPIFQDERADDSDGVSNRRFVIWYHYGLNACCNFYTALIVGLLHGTLMLFFVVNAHATQMSYNQTTNQSSYMSHQFFEKTISMPIMLYRIFIIFIPLLLVSTHCGLILSKAERDEVKAGSIKGNMIVLALAIAGCVFLSSYRVTVCVIKMQKLGIQSINLLGLVEAFLPVPQFIAQALVVYYGKTRKLNTITPLALSLQGLLSFLTVMNFILWLTDSLSAFQFFSLRSDLQPSTSSSLNTWIFFTELFLPPCIYFEYRCSLQLLSVKRFLWEASRNLKSTGKINSNESVSHNEQDVEQMTNSSDN